jgi:hypothetical protein
MRTKLTDAAIRSFKPREALYKVGDATCPGLCIRITPKGIKTFAFAYRNKATGKVDWLTIGRYPDVPLTRARERANDARKVVANGGTPLAPKALRDGKEMQNVLRGGRNLPRRTTHIAAHWSRHAHNAAADRASVSLERAADRLDFRR